jgi:hypothetical protein
MKTIINVMMILNVRIFLSTLMSRLFPNFFTFLTRISECDDELSGPENSFLSNLLDKGLRCFHTKEAML